MTYKHNAPNAPVKAQDLTHPCLPVVRKGRQANGKSRRCSSNSKERLTRATFSEIAYEITSHDLFPFKQELPLLPIQPH